MGNFLNSSIMDNDDCALQQKRFKTFLLFSVVVSLVTLGIIIFLRILFHLDDESIALWLTVPHWLSAATASLGFVIIFRLKNYIIKEKDLKKHKTSLAVDEARANLYTIQNTFISDMVFVRVQGIILFGIWLYRTIILASFHGTGIGDHYKPNHAWLFGYCLSGTQSCSVTEVILVLFDAVQFCVDISLVTWGIIFFIQYRGFEVNCDKNYTSNKVEDQNPLPEKNIVMTDISQASNFINSTGKLHEPQKYYPPDMRKSESYLDSKLKQDLHPRNISNEIEKKLITSSSGFVIKVD